MGIGEARQSSSPTPKVDIQAFETAGLYGASAASTVLSHLFRRIGGRLNGRPTRIIIIDEGWLTLDDPAFSAQLYEWLKTLRTKNAGVFWAQGVADIDGSVIAPVIIQSCSCSEPSRERQMVHRRDTQEEAELPDMVKPAKRHLTA